MLSKKARSIRLFVQTAVLFVILLAGSAAAAGAQDAPHLEGEVSGIDKHGNTGVNIASDAFLDAGFALGDVITVTAGSYTGDIPVLNGFYVSPGEYMLRVFPDSTDIALCICYGDFAGETGIAEGDPVTLTLKEKAGALTLQEINNLELTNDRQDYSTDEVFANFRPIAFGRIAEGCLYRSSSPVNNQYGRAPYADALAKKAGIRTVMNLANTDEEIAEFFAAEDFQSDYYKSLYEAGHVIPLGMNVDFSSDDFGKGIVKGLTFLSENEPPYLVHCDMGKDRAGFTSMILEALMGADLDEMRTDYMLSYVNYYNVEPGTEKYDLISENNFDVIFRIIAGLEEDASLEETDPEDAAESYLTAHGMSGEAIEALREKLSNPVKTEAETEAEEELAA